jgi:hypothetical protein
LKKRFFSPAPNGDSRVLKAKKTIFKSRYGMSLSIFLFLSELGTCPQNLIRRGGVEHWEKNHFPQGGMLKFTYKGRFLTIKIAYEISWIENPNGGNMLYFLLYTMKILFLENTKISIFGLISKFHLLAVLGSFGQNLLHW